MLPITEGTCGCALGKSEAAAWAQHGLKAELWLPQEEDLTPGLTEGTTLSPFIDTGPSGTFLGKSGSSARTAVPYRSPILPIVMVFYLLPMVLTLVTSHSLGLGLKQH